MTYKIYTPRRAPKNEMYKLIRKFMKVVPDYLPKYNALVDDPECLSDTWLKAKMTEIIEAAEREKLEAQGEEVGSV